MKKVTAAGGDNSVYVNPTLIIVPNAFMRNGTYSLTFIGRLYNSMRNETYPIMFIDRVYYSMRNGTYPIMFIGRVYYSMRNET